VVLRFFIFSRNQVKECRLKIVVRVRRASCHFGHDLTRMRFVLLSLESR
jgi:hypothetical protein